MRRLAVALVLVLVLTAAGTGAFVALRPGGGGEEAAAGPRRELKPWWWVPLVEEDASKPRGDMVINGIHVGPNMQWRGVPCGPGYGDPVPATPEEAAASGMDVSPAYLPEGAVYLPDAEAATKCGNQVVSVYKAWSVPADPVKLRWGGLLEISCMRADRYVPLDVPAERMGPGEVLGRPAVFVRPLTEDGFGQSHIIIADEYGITWVQADGITFDELLRVAESLYK